MSSKIRDIFNKPLRVCYAKAGTDKTCPYSDRSGEFSTCILFDNLPDGKLCSPAMRKDGERNL